MENEKTSYVYVEKDIFSASSSILTANAKLLYIYMRSKTMDQGISSFVSYYTIKNELGLSRDTAVALVSSLKKFGALRVDQGSFVRSNHYYFRIGTDRPIKADLNIVRNRELSKSAKLIYIAIDNGGLPLQRKQIIDIAGVSSSAFQDGLAELIGCGLVEKLHAGSARDANYYCKASGSSNERLLNEVSEAVKEGMDLFDLHCRKKGTVSLKKLTAYTEAAIGSSYFTESVGIAACAAQLLRDAVISDYFVRQSPDGKLYTRFCCDPGIQFSSVIKELIDHNEYPNCRSFLRSAIASGMDFSCDKKLSEELTDTSLNIYAEHEKIMADVVVKEHCADGYICINSTDDSQFKVVCDDNGLIEGERYRLFMKYREAGKGNYLYEVTCANHIDMSDNSFGLYRSGSVLLPDEYIVYVRDDIDVKNKSPINCVILFPSKGLVLPYKGILRLSDYPLGLRDHLKGFVLCVKACVYPTLRNGMIIEAEEFRYVTDTDDNKKAVLEQIVGMPVSIAEHISKDRCVFSNKGEFDRDVLVSRLEELALPSDEIQLYSDRFTMIFNPWEMRSILRKGELCADQEGYEELYTDLYKKFGANALSRLRDDPYILIGFGKEFYNCDKIAQHFCFQYNDTVRLRSFAEYMVALGIQDGDIGTTINSVMTSISMPDFQAYSRIPSEEEIVKAVESSEKIKQVGKLLISRSAERFEYCIADNIRRLNSSKKSFIEVNREIIDKTASAMGITLSEDKYDAIELIGNGGVCIITGGAGTGKSTVIELIVRLCESSHSDPVIRLCAPTGKAAENLNKLSDNKAVTIHSMIGFVLEGVEAKFGEKNPLNADIIIADEASMIDTELAARFFMAVKTGASVILVGDKNQLPPVGTGQVFSDILASGCCPYAELSVINRQKKGSSIISNSKYIMAGKSDLIDDDECRISIFSGGTLLEKAIVSTVRELKKNNVRNMSSLQVIVPFNRYTSGVNNLNIFLQNELNPHGKSVPYGGFTFREGDKVIFKRNTRYYKNGQTGVIIEVNKKPLAIKIKKDGESVVEVIRKDFDDVMLAYAMTVHKSQGSQFDNVIVAIPEDEEGFISRKFLYTAVTRAKKRLYIMSVKDGIQKAVNTDRDRLTLLKEKLSDPDYCV